MDERYLIHRLKSTSLAAVIGAISLGALILYHFHKNDIFRWDYLTILCLMAVTKIVTLIVLRMKN